MYIKKVTIFSKEYREVKRLQRTAFPANELYPMWVLRLLALRKNTHYLGFYNGGEFCGLLYYLYYREEKCSLKSGLSGDLYYRTHLSWETSKAVCSCLAIRDL